MRVRKSGSPEQRVGRAANVTIFLGILFAVSGLAGLAPRVFGLPDLGVAVGLIVLGYGIRFGSYAALGLAAVAFAALTVQAAARLADAAAPAPVVRAVVAAWMLASLCRAVPDMRALHRQGAFPLPMSRYGAFFLRRWRGKSNDR